MSIPAGWRLPAILSQGPSFPKADAHIQYLNGYLNMGRVGYKKVRIWVLVFVDKPNSAAEYQRMYWKDGNKNEVVVMFGISKDRDILWAEIMSQTEQQAFKIHVRDLIKIDMKDGLNGYSGKLMDEDMLKFSHALGEMVMTEYVKPDFDQYQYIKVAPSLTAILISYAIVLLVNIGVGVFVVKNAWHDKENIRQRLYQTTGRRPTGRRTSKRSKSKGYRYR